MGTSSSTLELGKAIRSLLVDTPVDDGIFNLLLNTALSKSELERALPFSTLRMMRHYYTRNFALLLFKCIEVVSQIRNASLESASDVQSASQGLQNALCLMRRIIPIAMEGGDTPCAAEEPVKRGAPPSNPPVEGANLPAGEANDEKKRTLFTATFVRSFFEENLACNDAQPEQMLPFLPGQNTTLSKFVGRLLVDCCFIRGLTLAASSLPAKESESHPCVDESLLWYPGVGGKQVEGSSTQPMNGTMHALRQELLYTLTALLSYPLFSPPGTRDTLFSEPLLNVDENPLLPTLVASTLNAILSYIPFGSIPYTSHWVGPEEMVVLMSSRFLSALICYPGALLDGSTQTRHTKSSEGNDKNEPKENVEAKDREDGTTTEQLNSPPLRIVHSARDLISAITPEEAKYIIERLKNTIGLKVYSNRTVLPDSQRCFITQDEFMMLLWRLIELSPECQLAFAQQPAALNYIVPFVDYALNAKRDPKYFPHLQLVLFLLLRLSETRAFCLQCNALFHERIPFEFDSFVGTYNDLLIIMLCSFILLRHELIRPLHVTCSAIISNIAPFMIKISPVTSEKLGLVFTSVSTRYLAYKALFASNEVILDDAEVKADQVVLLNIVEAVAGVLQYHEGAAATLLAAFIKHKSLVGEVSDIFLAEGSNAFLVRLTSPFLIGTVRDAITAVEGAVAAAEEAGIMDTVSVICKTSLVGALPTPHRIIVRRLYSNSSMEQWAMATTWSSLYMHTPPGTFGGSKSIKMLRFV
ncbi:putative High-temperature-induced dauer-formation protein [Trypanosoma cruzi]|nr:putative High-temperature-induced dauer-formation protein [Trypanosoma cruzi]